MSTIESISIIFSVFSVCLAISSLRLSLKSGKILNKTSQATDNSIKLIKEISELVNSSQDLGVTQLYSSRLTALNDYWVTHLKQEKKEIIILGTSLRGLIDGCSDLEGIVKEKPNIFKVLLAHPYYARAIQKQEHRLTLYTDIVNMIENLVKWGVPYENIKLFKGFTRNFTIITPTKILLNPSVYKTNAFRFVCIECERRHREDVYHQYKENHYKTAWNDEENTTPLTSELLTELKDNIKEWQKNIPSPMIDELKGE